MGKIWERITRKESPQSLEAKDASLTPHMTAKDLLGLGLGMVVGTAIFTLPGIVAAEHAGPAVALSFIIGAIGAGLAALAYAEAASLCRLLVPHSPGLAYYLAKDLVGLRVG